MRIVACFKAAPDAQDIQVKPGGELDLARAVPKIGAYDLVAIEAARQLADQVGGEVVGLTAGDPATCAGPKLRKDALSRGLDRLVTAPVEAGAELDSLQTASVLAAAINQIGEVDLVLCGAGSSDQYNQQVGGLLGALLGWPALNAVASLAPGGPGVGATVVVDRALEDSTQVVEVALPASLSVTSGINTPRIPGMRDILAAGKKAVDEAPGVAPGAGARVLATRAPDQAERAAKVLEAAPDAMALELAAFLKAN
ncbi:MAG: hypothetical protein LBD90_01490 [Bifidobacteriaceae bacterium]|jgi:electron transfer flavoprotein beta subunit|nr:hypothetical protein [Bifidobacteriaceae bacterium]